MNSKRYRDRAFKSNIGQDGDPLDTFYVQDLRRGRVIEWVHNHEDMEVLGFPYGCWGPVVVLSCRRVGTRRKYPLAQGGQDAYKLKLAWAFEKAPRWAHRSVITVVLHGGKKVKAHKRCYKVDSDNRIVYED